MYTQGIPCNECAKVIINAGIKRIIYHNLFVNHGEIWAEAAKYSNTMFKECGLRLTYIDYKLGVKTLVDGKIIEV